MKAKLYITFFLCCLGTTLAYAQIIPPKKDSIPNSNNLDALIQPSQQPGTSDPLPGNSSSPNLDSIKISKDALDDQVDYDARDSMRLDVINETVHLYGNAIVKYNDLTVTAAYIYFNMDSSIVYATGMIDSSGRLGGFPVFEQKDQKIDAKRLRYNFNTNKGIIYDAKTTQMDMVVHSKYSNYFGSDSTNNQNTDVIYSEGGIASTCNHPEPHFGVRSSRQKVIPDDVVIVGPSNIEVGGIPTPLWLPFAFFPLTDGPRTGLIFPQDYEYSDALGFGLKEVGWYFPIAKSDYWDLKLTGKIYTRGTWGVAATSQYRKRYKYNGRLTLSYSDLKTESQAQKLSQKSLSIRWNHSQDPKSHPTNRFSGSVNIQTNDYQSLNENDANSVLQNTLSSNVSFSKSFPGKPFSLTVAMNHSQNTQTKQVNISLPNINFNMNRIYPFKRKNALGGKERWYEKIGVQYKAAAQNRITATDTTLFTNQTLEDMQFGIRHTADANASFRVLKYFNLTPSINYKEIWYFDRVRKTLLDEYEVDTTEVEVSPLEFRDVLDTTQYGVLEEMKDFGFNPLRLFNTGVSMSTQIFGQRNFRKGKIRGIRHIIKPSASFNYTPDYTNGFGYFDYHDTDLREEENERRRYSIFENGIYEDVPTSGRQMALGYSINNIFEAKYWSSKDSTAKNFKLFDNIVINGNYNFAADSLKWSQINLRGTTRLFGRISTLNIGTQLDPYAVNENGTRINTFNKALGGNTLRYVRSNIRLNTGFSIKDIRELFEGKKDEKSKDERSDDPRQENAGTKKTDFQTNPMEDNLLDLFSNFRVSHNLVVESTADTFFIRTNNLELRGRIQLTSKWSLDIKRIAYDFKTKSLVYPDIGFYRDLHCWEMGMDWRPSRNVFSFYLRVKPGTLDFIKVPYGRNNQDGFGGF